MLDVEKEDNADFIWYLASLVAADPEAVYNEYVEATRTKIYSYYRTRRSYKKSLFIYN